ncbi:S9 family peptidase [Flavobacterium franklandianum]|uniref:S9 family peptidase n=1 Tax=Flavobacterium franklandianum TaxID=2594430 RepID=A0A553C7D3_9FLAO|nr:S9 family peptidase [Flavobacterium franklandianum]TRX16353.1 S9 family peptidase [Flavobacterium franklandianum]TRX24323.1 S9 family peptidase [Flavobacterium franklandianum]
MKNKLFFILTIMVTSLNAQNFIGDWKGQLSVQGIQMEIIFHINEKDNQFLTTLDVPIQGAVGIPLDKTEMNGVEISIAATKMGITFKGQLKDKTIEGVFKQAGMDLPLTLTKFESKLPGNIKLPSSNQELLTLRNFDKGNYKYKVSDYFAKPKASGFKLSPNGQFLSYREKDDKNKRHIYVKNIKTGETKRAIEEKEELVRDYGWINNERLYFAMDKGGDENYHIYAVNLDGSNLKDMTPFDGVTASITKILKEQKDYIIISMNKNNKQVFEPYKLNVVTGDLVQLFKNKDIENPIQGFEFDKDGQLRGYSKLVNGVTNEMFYKNLKTGEFNLIATNNWNDTFEILSFNYASKNPNEAYMMTNLDSNTTQIVLYDLENNKIVKEIFSNPTFDVSGMSLSRKRNWEINNFAFEGEKYEMIPVSKFYKSIDSQMKKEFPNKEAQIVGYDDDENNFLVIVQSDKLYGKYYQYDVKTKKFTLLFDLMPQLQEADMAEMRPIKFKSRDGLTIYGYITLPKEALTGKKVPLIVNPHGGPQGIRDSWGFNPETQLYASRGYATLQVNFRISGGYGKEFLRAGFKQIGRKLMDDVEDGVKYSIEQGWVDKDKMAIYGGSHGGYATLMGLVKNPDLYTCGVDYVGVSNIFTFFDSFPEYWKPYKEIVKEIWYDLDKPEEAAIAKEVSPIFQVDKIKKPLFVIQGANDPRVKIAESDQIVTSLRAKGFDVPYMVKYDEGHGFGKEENSIEMYEATLGFLSKYLK